ncbi:MAG: transposase, partial [Lachnospiraceae bacterium]|nr:transposase [Lachnospiraceae bacterium]
RKKIYSIQLPQAVILDLDSTLLDAYGRQEGRAFNFHYQSNGYHPLVCYDGMTGDLIKIQLRDGTEYSCTGVVDFLQPILDEYLNDYPEIRILLRGDSGFATPGLYKQCEENGTSYVIRLKENGILLQTDYIACPVFLTLLIKVRRSETTVTTKQNRDCRIIIQVFIKYRL